MANKTNKLTSSVIFKSRLLNVLIMGLLTAAVPVISEEAGMTAADQAGEAAADAPVDNTAVQSESSTDAPSGAVNADQPADPATQPPAGSDEGAGSVDGDAGTAASSEIEEGVFRPLKIMGQSYEPSSRKNSLIMMGENFLGTDMNTPLTVIRGSTPGPIACITGGIHGDELNSIETVRRLTSLIDPEKLSGTIIAMPIINVPGFRRGSRYLPDRRDLNRYFPGRPTGSMASRMANTIFSEVIRHCEFLVDFHTGSLDRSNYPQVRADMSLPAIRKLAYDFGGDLIVHKPGGSGTLRYAANKSGIPTILFESGQPHRFEMKKINIGIDGVLRLLRRRKMYDTDRVAATKPDIYYQTRWQRANSGGIMFTRVTLGETVVKDQVLAEIIDPLSNEKRQVRSRYAGRVIGMATSQAVMPGFAIFHLGVKADQLQGEERKNIHEDEERPE